MPGYARALRRYTNTVFRETPSDLAISSAFNPFSRSFKARSGSAFVVPGCRELKEELARQCPDMRF
jgi:hypothetical protein